MFAEFRESDRHDGDREHAGTERIQVRERANELRAVVHAGHEHNLRMKRDAPLAEPAQLRDDFRSFRIAQQPAANHGIARVHGDIERRQAVLDDPVVIPRLQIGQRGEVAVAKRETVIVVADVERLAHALRIAIHEAEVAMVRAAPNTRRLERNAHRQTLGPLDVVLDFFSRR